MTAPPHEAAPGEHATTTAARIVRAPRPRPLWHFVLLSTATFGLYQLVWLYRTWRYVGDVRGERVQPLLRSLFAPLFAYGLFRRLFEMARSRGYPEEPPALPLALAYFAFGALAWMVPLPLGLVGLLNVVPLLPAVETQQYAVRAAVPELAEQDAGFARDDLLWLAIGALLWARIIAVILDPSLLAAHTAAR